MNLTQTIEATVKFWAGDYEIEEIILPYNVYNQLAQEARANPNVGVFTQQGLNVHFCSIPARLTEAEGCFTVITGKPLPTAEFYDPNNISMGDALEMYRQGMISIKDFRAEFVDDAPPPGLVWES